MEKRRFARMSKVVINKIAELTDMNEHGMALSCLAMELNSGDAFVKLAKINVEHEDANQTQGVNTATLRGNESPPDLGLGF